MDSTFNETSLRTPESVAAATLRDLFRATPLYLFAAGARAALATRGR